MKSFRNPKYLERYEDVVFDLEQALVVPATTTLVANETQARNNLRFVVDNTSEMTPFDWYNARFSLDFRLELLATNNIAASDHNGTVNGASSFIGKIKVLANGREIYSCNNANHCVNIKNVLEYNPSFVESVASNEYYYLDTSGNAEERTTEADYNKGFAARKRELGASATVNCEIPLNRYSFFEALEDKLLTNTKIEISVEFDEESNIIWEAGANCRFVFLRFQFFVPRLTF